MKHYKPVEALKIGDVIAWQGAPYEVANVYEEPDHFITLSLIPLNKFIVVTINNTTQLEILSC